MSNPCHLSSGFRFKIRFSEKKGEVTGFEFGSKFGLLIRVRVFFIENKHLN